MTDTTLTDKLYADPRIEISRFNFDEKVAQVFPDMIQRSVPGYSTILSMIGNMAKRYAQPNSRCYDLGCSLGASTLAMRQQITVDNCSIIGVDNSQAMINRCQAIIDNDYTDNEKYDSSNSDNNNNKTVTVELHCCDIQSITIKRASIVVLNFTLQFIPLEQRPLIISHIYKGLLPGGVLLLSEKIISEEQAHQRLMTELYYNFKRTNGYSDLEIAQKRSALENVLQAESIDRHKQRLKKVGFNSVDVWFQCLNFASFIAIKS